ncbi:MAG: DUF1737 domain-containing protein [Balneola sp.]
MKQYYKIIQAYDSAELAKKVNEEIERGYIPFGSLNVSPQSVSAEFQRIVYTQAVVLKGVL